MIFLFTDFGYEGPYVGQMKAVLQRAAPDVPVVDIMHDAPVWNPRHAAYLLAALARQGAAGDLWLGVVDPGVGGARRPLILEADGIQYVGPDNGLFELVGRRADRSRWWQIDWRPDVLADTFHGRDLFAPVAAAFALGEDVARTELAANSVRPGRDWPDDLTEIIYIDGYGNLVTGLDGERISEDRIIEIAGRSLAFAPTFSAVPDGTAFWYRNSAGLVEIAANQARADSALGLTVGDSIELR